VEHRLRAGGNLRPGGTIARDIVRHFLGRGFMGKAMMISINKATTVRIYDKVQRCWQQETERVLSLVEQLPPEPSEAADELRQRLPILTTTEMAVIVSASQNEIADSLIPPWATTSC
jgi:type I restriction enzyme R subunit